MYKIFAIKLVALVLTVKLNLVSGLDKNKDCQCKLIVEKNIVKGRTSQQNSFPWIASVTDALKNNPTMVQVDENSKIKDHVANGIILNESWILTSKELTTNEDPTVYSVGFGTDKVTMFDDRGKIKAAEVIHHPSPNVDISLLRLSKPISFSENLRPACIDTNQYEKIKNEIDHLTVCGFGRISPFILHKNTGKKLYFDQEKQSYVENVKNIETRYLKEADLKEVSNKVCEIYPTLLCAKNKEYGDALCEGDMAAPLHYSKNGKTFVVGLLKFYTNEDLRVPKDFIHYCGEKTLSVFDKISPHITWIEEHLGRDSYCDDKIDERLVDRKRKFKLFGKDVFYYPEEQGDPKSKTKLQ